MTYFNIHNHWPLRFLHAQKWIDCEVSCLVRIGLQTAFLFIFSLCLFSSVLFWLHSTWCLIRLVLIHSPSDWLNTGCLKSANMGRPDYMCLCVWLWEIWMCLCEMLFVVIVAIMFVYLQVLVFVCMPVKSNSLLAMWPGVSQLWDITKINPGRISFQKREKNKNKIKPVERSWIYLHNRSNCVV